MPRDLYAELTENGDDETGWPKAWHPESEPVLVGAVIRYTIAPGKQGECRTCLLQRDDGSRIAVWLNSVVLQGLFEQEDPQPGDRIGLRFLGVHPTKSYKRFKMVVDRDETPSSAPSPPARPTAAPAPRTNPCAAPADDEGPFGSCWPEGYAAATTQRAPAGRVNGKPLTIAPPRGARR